jgi:murein L,D-transpeptidase YcbB/YkuD
MNKLFRFGFYAALISILFIATGCAKTTTSKKRISALEAQVGVLTDEIARLDQQLQSARGSAAISSSDYTGGRSASQTAVYKTPSGFELSSTDIQKALKSAGYYQGDIDGRIGPGTKDAVKAFQRDHGLGPDGVVGRQTWEKLKTYLTASN